MTEYDDKRIIAEIDERLASMKKLLSEHELNQKKPKLMMQKWKSGVQT